MAGNRRPDTGRWDTALDPLCVPLFLSLQWARSRSLAHMQPVRSRHRLSAAEFDVLATLRNSAPPHRLTPSQVRDQVVITSGGLTKLMLQLEARGLLLRPPSAGDQRVKPVQLSEAGRQAIEAAMADMLVGLRAWLTQALGEDEITCLTGLLQRLADAGPP